MLNAIPANKLDYKPHPDSPSAQQLVWTLAMELRSAAEACEKGETSFPKDPAPELAAMISTFEAHHARLDAAVSRLDAAGWEKPARLTSGGKVVMEQPVREFVWMLLSDAIHHRGQLSAYLRPMGGKVPSIYGPSADSRRQQP